MPTLTRREFLKVSTLTAGALSVSFGLTGCSDSDGNNTGNANSRVVEFQHGVASGDPLSDSVMLWTRITPLDEGGSISVNWEVARDAAFTDLTHDGQMTASAAHDYTVKIDVRNLLPGTRYYYRFRAAGISSPTGITATLPLTTDQVRLAVVSCSNYPAGYFHAYAAIADQADSQMLDAVLHLGDYLYEYGMGGYATDAAEALGRTLPEDNATELLTLTDYRKRYALYRTDTDLQSLHARLPWIVVWDDHEVTNDAWESGAENHNEGEGDFTARKYQALQAYFEWLPIRPAREDDKETIYRSFRFGDLVALQMLDTRIIARDEQLDYANYVVSDGHLDTSSLVSDLTDPTRELLGDAQQLWLQSAVTESLSLRWQVLGQQVLMARMALPAELLLQLQEVYAGKADASTLQSLISEYIELKQRQAQGDTLSASEQSRLDTVLPYNLDAWDGYSAARERTLAIFQQAGSNLVVLAGDTHNAWASLLTRQDGTAVGVEFAVSSVSSPGLESYLGDLDSDTLAQALTVLIDDLRYANLSQRGFMIVDFTHAEARAAWYFIDTVKSRDYSLIEGPVWRTPAGSVSLEAV
ncbi:alkaline phosphatase D family protein [Modicisalibacter luteus]|uniref:Alkaline phosphatase D family protein n=1 Tax=Modicisalibacter luteus TaxID=453962 RepID=A0ABV7LW97_9GAMM|nr:alkaline phosphatase D family protein [Halomonas lutea]GHB06590.1 alkaline phosphatase [Halomonas lutea]